MWFIAGFAAGIASLAGAICFKLHRLGKELVGKA